MPAENILKSGWANKRHRTAAIEALFKKTDEQAQTLQAMLLKKWIKDGNSISIPQNDTIIWGAIQRSSGEVAYRWHGLVLLAAKYGISLTIEDKFLTHLSDYFFNEDKQATTNSANRLMALYFLECFIDTATPNQHLIIFGVLIRALYDKEDEVADRAWEILQNNDVTIPATELRYYVQESIELISNTKSLTRSEKGFIKHFLPQSSGEDRLNLLSFISDQNNSEIIIEKKLLTLQYIAKGLTQAESSLAFVYVSNICKSITPIPVHRFAWNILSTLTPQLSEPSLDEVILQIRNSLKNSSAGLAQMVLQTLLKENMHLIAPHHRFPEIFKQLLGFIETNIRGPRVAQLSFEALALAANYMSNESRQESINIITKIINESQDPQDRKIILEAFDALSSFCQHLSNEQVDKLFNQAMEYACSDEFFDYALEILIALASVLTPEKIAEAIQLIAGKTINSLNGDNLSDIVTLKLTFFINLANRLDVQHLDAVNQAILEGLNQQDHDLPIDVLRMFLPKLNQQQRQVFFDRAMALWDKAESRPKQSALEIINIMNDHLSTLQVQQYVQKIGLTIPKELDAENTIFCLENMVLIFDKVKPDAQAIILNTLCQATNHADHTVKNTAVHSIIYFAVRGDIDKNDIKNKLPEPESEFINYFLNAYEQIKQAEVSHTLSYGSC